MWRRVPQKQPGKPAEKATHMYIFAPEVFSNGLQDDTKRALAYVGTEEELQDFRHEAIDNWATKAPLDEVKVTVQFYGISRAIKHHNNNFGEFEAPPTDNMFWRRLFFMIIYEVLEIKLLEKPVE